MSHSSEEEFAIGTIWMQLANMSEQSYYGWDRLEAWLAQHAPGSEVQRAIAEIRTHMRAAAGLLAALDDSVNPLDAIAAHLNDDWTIEAVLAKVLAWRRPAEAAPGTIMQTFQADYQAAADATKKGTAP